VQVIIPYFEYTGNPRRRANLDATLKQLGGIDHVVSAFCDNPPPDALSFDHGAMIWQKERLVNLAVDAAGTSHDRIIILDADCIFQNHDWLDNINRALDECDIVQCFNSLEYQFDDRNYNLQGAVASYRIYGKYTGSVTGGAWAFRAPFPRYYEHCVVGGGDTAFCDKLLDRGSTFIQSQAHRAHYLAWYSSQAQRTFGYANNTAKCLPCGSFHTRNFASRHRILRNYSPLDDTFTKPGELLQMPNKKLELAILDFLVGRDK